MTSCQSEYDKQILHAKELVRQEMLLKNTLYQETELNDNMVLSLQKVQEELEFRAHLSGNQRLFLNQVQHLRVKEADYLNNPALLITKFP